MDDPIFEETEKILSQDGKNRNGDIIEAVKFYNVLRKRRMLCKQRIETCAK